MQHTKQIINEAGDKININVTFWMNNDKPFYNVGITICKKGKRKFNDPMHGISDDYSYRALAMDARREFIFNEILKIVPIELINTAKNELYELLKP